MPFELKVSCRNCKYEEDGLCELYGLIVDNDTICERWVNKINDKEKDDSDD